MSASTTVQDGVDLGSSAASTSTTPDPTPNPGVPDTDTDGAFTASLREAAQRDALDPNNFRAGELDPFANPRYEQLWQADYGEARRVFENLASLVNEGEITLAQFDQIVDRFRSDNTGEIIGFHRVNVNLRENRLRAEARRAMKRGLENVAMDRMEQLKDLPRTGYVSYQTENASEAQRLRLTDVKAYLTQVGLSRAFAPSEELMRRNPILASVHTGPGEFRDGVIAEGRDRNAELQAEVDAAEAAEAAERQRLAKAYLDATAQNFETSAWTAPHRERLAQQQAERWADGTDPLPDTGNYKVLVGGISNPESFKLNSELHGDRNIVQSSYENATLQTVNSIIASLPIDQWADGGGLDEGVRDVVASLAEIVAEEAELAADPDRKRRLSGEALANVTDQVEAVYRGFNTAFIAELIEKGSIEAATTVIDSEQSRIDSGQVITMAQEVLDQLREALAPKEEERFERVPPAAVASTTGLDRAARAIAEGDGMRAAEYFEASIVEGEDEFTMDPTVRSLIEVADHMAHFRWSEALETFEATLGVQDYGSAEELLAGLGGFYQELRSRAITNWFRDDEYLA